MPFVTEAQYDAGRLGCDLFIPRSFPRFSDLPAELRYKIYEQYFLGEHSAVTCRSWPKLDYAPYVKWTVEQSFLPGLCFVSKTIRSEAIDILMSSATMEITSKAEGRHVSEMARRNINQQLFSMTRKLAFTEINMPADQEWMYLSPLGRSLTVGPNHKGMLSARVSNMVYSQLIHEITPRFQNLRELLLGFHAPTASYTIYQRSYTYPIDSLLRSFKPPSLGMPKLRKVTVSAHASSEYIWGAKNFTWEGTKCLRAVMVPAQKIKDDLAGWGRDVTVKVQLFYLGKCEATVLEASKSNRLLVLRSSTRSMKIWDRLAANAKPADS